MVLAAKKAGVQRFVYCSSSSVYGVSDSPDVTEDHPLVPLTLYNKYKGMCEPLLWKHKADDFTCVVIRPATVCGYSPRTRLDLSVNILTNHAVNKGMITVFGGNQMRPNLHVEDMVDAYELMLDGAAREDRMARPSTSASRIIRSPTSRRWSKQVVEEEFPEQGADQDRHHADQRHPLLSRQLGQDRRACSASSRSARSKMPCAIWRAPSRQATLPNSFDDDWYYNVRTHEEARSGMTANADRRRHGRRRFHRQPHGRSAARARLSRCASSTIWSAAASRTLRSTRGNPDSRLRAARHPRLRARRSRCSTARDYVFHFAGIGDIVPSIEQPIDYMSTNVQGTVHVLECARARRRRKFVYAASSSCYGLAADADARRPSDRAAISLCAVANTRASRRRFTGSRSTGCRSTRSASSTPTARARAPSGAYGAVFGVFLKQKLAGKPFTVVGDGTQTRDFLYVTDVADGLPAAAETERRGEVWNVGAGNPQSVNRLVELLGGPVVHIPKRPGEPDCTFADISKITRELGWKPQVSFEEGVRAHRWPRSTTGGMRRCGIPSRSPRRPRRWFRLPWQPRVTHDGRRQPKYRRHKIKTAERAARR